MKHFILFITLLVFSISAFTIGYEEAMAKNIQKMYHNTMLIKQ